MLELTAGHDNEGKKERREQAGHRGQAGTDNVLKVPSAAAGGGRLASGRAAATGCMLLSYCEAGGG